jgi:PIN domain nuclease of toxin-antitoxin system
MLLDTCALVWLASGDAAALSDATRMSIAKADHVHVSGISAFEIGLLYAGGKLDLPCDPARWYESVLAAHDILEVPVDGRIAIAATKLQPIHRDPCDRFIIATAMLNNWPVVTADSRFADYGVRVMR